MTQLALARKWRPRRLADLVGQEHVVRALTHALTTGRLHHAYLFTGTRGIGKTTISRILAKALNCETGITPTPCNRCRNCQEIDADRFPDYVEMDAASNRGVDEMAALLEQAAYAPVAGRFKVYMIDEVHMLTGHAFNAMLKTLEEPPEHVKFVLATTDPQKIPVTVLSRCLQFGLRALTPEAIADRCASILTAEGIAFETAALPLIGQAARGSMRDALSLLEQAIAYGAGTVTEADVRSMLGLVSETVLIDLLRALADGDLARYWSAVGALVSGAIAGEAVLAMLAQRFHQIARSQFGALLGDGSPLSELARRWDPEFVQLAYTIVVQGRRDLPLAPDEATGVEMTLLRLLAFAPQNEPTPAPLPPGPAPEPFSPAPLASSPASPSLPITPAPAPPTPARAADDPALPNEAAQATALHRAGDNQRPVQETTQEIALLSAAWLQTVAQLPLTGVLRTFADHCALVADDGTIWTIGVDRPAHHWLGSVPELGEKLREAFVAALAQVVEETPPHRREQGQGKAIGVQEAIKRTKGELSPALPSEAMGEYPGAASGSHTLAQQIAPHHLKRRWQFVPTTDPIPTLARQRAAAEAAEREALLAAAEHHPGIRLLTERLDLEIALASNNGQST